MNSFRELYIAYFMRKGLSYQQATLQMRRSINKSLREKTHA